MQAAAMQDMQELAHCQIAAYEQLDQQRREAAEEAMQRYVFNGNLLKEICQGSAINAMSLPAKSMSLDMSLRIRSMSGHSMQ